MSFIFPPNSHPKSIVCHHSVAVISHLQVYIAERADRRIPSLKEVTVHWGK